MMDVLMESGARPRERRARWTATSVVVHAAIATAALAVTRGPSNAPAGPVDSPRPVVWVAPSPPTSRPTAPTINQLGVVHVPSDPRIDIPTSVSVPAFPTFDAAAPAARALASVFRQIIDGPRASTHNDVTQGTGIHPAAAVERIAAPRPENPRPDYPSALRSAAIEGEVLITFVVDSSGRVEPGSLTIVQSSHALFAESVRRWLPRTRYRPAEVGGRPVRQLVRQQVGFALQDQR